MVEFAEEVAGDGDRSRFGRQIRRGSLPEEERIRPIGPDARIGLVGEFLDLVEKETEADPAGLLVQFLAYFGNAVGRHPHLRIEAARHGTNLNVILVGATAKGRKGTAEAHVRRLFEMADPDWYSNCIASGLSSGEGLIYHVRDPEYAKNSKGVLVVQDEGVPDKRLLVVEGEFGRAMSVMAREGNTLSATIRDAWDGNRVLRTLVKNAPTKATEPHISIVAHTTRQEVLTRLREVETFNGFANRFLWVFVSRSRVLPFGGEIDQTKLSSLAQQVGNQLQESRELGKAYLDEDARALWCEKYERLSTGLPGLLGAATARAEAQVMRLALVYALTAGQSVITQNHLLAAFEIWRYCLDSARRIFGDSLGNAVADRIIRELRVTPGGLTRTDISHQIFNRNRKAHQIEDGLRILSKYQLAYYELETDTNGRPAERWFSYSSL